MEKLISKKYYLIFALFLMIGVIFFALNSKQLSSTNYQNNNGEVFECSQPINVKKEGGTILGHEHYLPIDQAEADKYCHFTGIE